MGIIKAAVDSVRGTLADQWLEVFEADNMSDSTVFCFGVMVRKNDRRSNNRKGTADVISNGSVVHVAPGQFMMLTDGGKVIDYTAEPGYYKVDQTAAPSLFGGDFEGALKDSFDRIRFGGAVPYQQKVFFINLQEIKNIAFGTVNPINYFDNFYNAELFLRAHGYFSIRITDPIKFYAEAIPRNADRVEITDIHRLYLAEFLNGLQTAINQMSADNIRISHVTSQGVKTARYLADALDEEWTQRRGMEIVSVGIQSISYDEESKKLINMRNQGAMLSDAAVREGYVQGAIARGLEASGSNSSGSMAGFMGIGMGMQSAGNFMSSASQTNRAQMESQQAQRAGQQQQAQASNTWICSCGKENGENFCSACGKARPEPTSDSWTCSCGKENNGNFCSACGKARPQKNVCPKCGWTADGDAAFCSRCGTRMQ